jgi:predicted nucleic acid-binding protein
VPEVIADTSPLQYLHQTGLLHLLPAFYGIVTVPSAVARELAEGRARGISLPDPATLNWIKIEETDATESLPPTPGLGRGEREVLALSAQRPNSLALLDDALARRYARLFKIDFTGTLGVLLKAKQEGQLTALAPVLDRLELLRFRLDQHTRAATLQLAGETDTQASDSQSAVK